MSKTRKSYSAEFKKECVDFAKSTTRPLKEIAAEMNVTYSLLCRWVRESRTHDTNAFSGNGNPIEKEVHELKKKLREVEEERDILKKAMVIFSKK